MQLMQEPFGRIYNGNTRAVVDNHTILDAIYIPTLSSSCGITTQLQLLLKYSKEIVVIYSDALGLFSSNCPPFMRIEKITDHRDFLNEFNSKASNSNIAINWRPSFDIPHKRSFALKDARDRNYQNIMLLDDDLNISEGNIISGLSALHNGAVVVGFHVIDYPDVSTIDHLERIVLSKDNTISMTGSCMFINVDLVEGDFINAYNEDLFFFLSQKAGSRVVSGGCIFQNKKQPWLDLDRVKHEQFGDLIYDSLKKQFLSNKYKKIDWHAEINERLARIHLIRTNTTDTTVINALDSAEKALRDICISDITNFIHSSYLSERIKELCSVEKCELMV